MHGEPGEDRIGTTRSIGGRQLSTGCPRRRAPRSRLACTARGQRGPGEGRTPRWRWWRGCAAREIEVDWGLAGARWTDVTCPRRRWPGSVLLVIYLFMLTGHKRDQVRLTNRRLQPCIKVAKLPQKKNQGRKGRIFLAARTARSRCRGLRLKINLLHSGLFFLSF